MAFIKILKKRGPRSRKTRKKIASRALLTKAALASREKIRRIEMFSNLPTRIGSKAIERVKVREIWQWKVKRQLCRR